MKALVVEIRGKKAAVLKEDGTVDLIANAGYMIGQSVELSKARKLIRFSKGITAAAAAAAVFITAGSLYAYAYVTPYRTITDTDNGTTVEYTVNRFDRVLSVKASGNDADKIQSEISYHKFAPVKAVQEETRNKVSKFMEQNKQMEQIPETDDGKLDVSANKVITKPSDPVEEVDEDRTVIEEHKDLRDAVSENKPASGKEDLKGREIEKSKDKIKDNLKEDNNTSLKNKQDTVLPDKSSELPQSEGLGQPAQNFDTSNTASGNSAEVPEVEPPQEVQVPQQEPKPPIEEVNTEPVKTTEQPAAEPERTDISNGAPDEGMGGPDFGNGGENGGPEGQCH